MYKRRILSIPKNILIFPFRYKLGYDVNHYLIGDNPERQSYKLGIIRPGDMGAALAYAFGIDNYTDVSKIFGIKSSELCYLPRDTTCNEQVKELLKHQKRKPKLVVEVGCGRGELASALSYAGVRCIGIDPAKGASVLVKRTSKEFFDRPTPFEFLNATALNGLKEIYHRKLNPDTIIFCESIEHISRSEFLKVFEIAKALLTETYGLLIITNFISFHPIERSADMHWTHIQQVDDELYDHLASKAQSIIFRKGSHLVLQF